jgi:flavodoxin
MKALVVYHSLFGNTKAIAEAVASQLGSQVMMKPVQQLVATDLEGTGLLVLGTPTHRMMIPPEANEAIAKLPKHSLKGVKVAAFDTSMKVNWFVDMVHAASQLLRKLRKLGGQAVAEPAVFWVTGFKGPLKAGEIERSKTWAQSFNYGGTS